MSKVYAGLYHISGTVKELGVEGLGDYKGVVDSDVLIADDDGLDSENNVKALVDILDFNGERVTAYVLIEKLEKVPHEPVERVPGWENRISHSVDFGGGSIFYD